MYNYGDSDNEGDSESNNEGDNNSEQWGQRIVGLANSGGSEQRGVEAVTVKAAKKGVIVIITASNSENKWSRYI